MSRTSAARITFGLTALAAVVGLGLSLYVAGITGSEQFASVGARLFNQLCYFTLQSNIIVAVTCGLLALSLDRTSMVFRVFRLAGLVDIVITGVVYYLLISEPQDTFAGWLGSTLMHAVVPIACVVGWLVFGPRGLVSARVAGWAMLVPLAWLVLTLVRGAVIGWYPYAFIDVDRHGYGQVLLNVAVMAVFFLVLYGAAVLVSRRLSGPDGAREPARG